MDTENSLLSDDELKEQINGCDKISRVYGNMFHVLQDLMQNEDKLKKLNPLDYSALGIYMGKFVEQEINSSVVQIMRAFRGIKMPDYYCKYYPGDIDADVVCKNEKTVRLNEHKNPHAPDDSLKTIPSGDAYRALEALKFRDTEGFFKDYPWLFDRTFLESWRKLYNFRNRTAHIGEIIDAETLKDNHSHFLRFLHFMPDILKVKKKLAPVQYVEEVSPIEKNLRKPYFTSSHVTEKPHPPIDIAKRFNELEKIYFKSNHYDNDALNEINDIIANYNLDAIIFEGDNGRQGMKDCLGNLLVPANYDGFGFIPQPFNCKRNGVIAIRDGRYVVVSLDGTGKDLTKETYDEILLASYQNLASPYIYRKNGLSSWGFMDLTGKEICDCIVDEFYEQLNYAWYSSGGLWGYWGFLDNILLPPIYDNIESGMDGGNLLTFTLNNERGYVKYDGSFVSLSDLEKLDEDTQFDIKCECMADPNLDY